MQELNRRFHVDSRCLVFGIAFSILLASIWLYFRWFTRGMQSNFNTIIRNDNLQSMSSVDGTEV